MNYVKKIRKLLANQPTIGNLMEANGERYTKVRQYYVDPLHFLETHRKVFV